MILSLQKLFIHGIIILLNFPYYSVSDFLENSLPVIFNKALNGKHIINDFSYALITR